MAPHMESPAPSVTDGNRAKVRCAEFGHPLDSKPDLILQLDLATRRLDRHTALLQRSLDLRELLHMGIFDVDDAIAEVAAFRRDCKAMRGTGVRR
jgi:hypothetical protein